MAKVAKETYVRGPWPSARGLNCIVLNMGNPPLQDELLLADYLSYLGMFENTLLALP